jgi:hypothetical protein
MKSLQEELRHLINCRSLENGSNTPDFILAGYLVGCLAAFDVAVRERSKFYGREHQKPGHGDGLPDESEILITEEEEKTSGLRPWAPEHPINQLRGLIDQIGNIGNRPDMREWREKSLAQIAEVEAQIEIARRRLGPAGYRILEEYRGLSKQRADFGETTRLLNLTINENLLVRATLTRTLEGLKAQGVICPPEAVVKQGSPPPVVNPTLATGHYLPPGTYCGELLPNPHNPFDEYPASLPSAQAQVDAIHASDDKEVVEGVAHQRRLIRTLTVPSFSDLDALLDQAVETAQLRSPK